METMISTLINVRGIGYVICLQRFLIDRPTFGDARIQRGVVKQKRRFYSGSICGGRLLSVEWNRSCQIRSRTASLLAMVPPKQKPTTPILPVQSIRDLSQAAEATKSSNILLWSTWRKSPAPLPSSPERTDPPSFYPRDQSGTGAFH